MNVVKIIHIIFLSVTMTLSCFAQISPGELSDSHSHLEGISNCTQCHTIGEKVSKDKCLNCHTEIKERLTQNKGYHSSSDIKSKECALCHSDHHGKKFQIIRFDTEKFNHSLTGFTLSGAHSKKKCIDCHNSKNINIQKIKDKKFTYLGLNISCKNCHADYHQNTLSANCLNCHGVESFKPASKFNHVNAKFKLTGKHKSVECVKCHQTETVNGIKFQKFTGLPFKSCTNCHTDIHKNQFGQNCIQCHSEESFHDIKGIKNFDHTKTKYKLEEKHLVVPCKSCHKNKYTTSLKYQKCNDCHTDYHKNQFAKEGVSPDCSVCHNTSGFVNFSYTIEQHNQSIFALQGAHLATPCFSCHKKEEKWTFRDIGKRCIDCHADIHKEYINKKYYPDDNCRNCHVVNKWSEINFDHSKTNFTLSGIHSKQSCSKCHFNANTDGSKQQRFSNLPANCTTCHADKHFKQFDINGITDCNRCHEPDNWKPVKFNHNNASFKLDGKHVNVPCIKCHKVKEENQIKYLQYKISAKCESCHS